MNILFVDKRFPNYGGIAVVTSMLSKQFVKDGHKVFVATLMPSIYEGMNDLIPDGVSVLNLETPIWKLSNIGKIRKIIVDNDIDVIIDQWALHFEVAFIINLARRGTKAKLIVELHGAADTTKMIIEQTDKVKCAKNLISKLYQKFVLKLCHCITKYSVKYVYGICDKYVLLSNGFIPELINYAGLKESSKIIAIGNAISIPNDGFEYDSNLKEKRLLYVGRMDPYNKRVIRIVKAWQQLYKQYPDWSLELVGEGPELKSLKRYINENAIERVNFYKFTKEPPTKHYKKASILMLTSDLEGFGLVIIESMQFGCVPVVYGSYIAVHDIIESGKDGFITPKPYATENTINCLKKIMNDDDLRKKMAISAVEKSRCFTIENIVKKWYSIF